MNVLFDTHLLLWALTDDDRLPQKARDILMDTTNNIYYSVVSIWEIAIKHQLHPDVIDFSGLEISVFCDEAGFLSVPLKEKHIIELETLDADAANPIHKDPFDRILLSQARSERMTFMTHDKTICRYPEKCVLLV